MVIEERTQIQRAIKEGVKKVRKKQVKKKLKKLAKGLRKNGNGNGGNGRPKSLGATLVADIQPGLAFLTRKKKRNGPTFT